MCAPFSTSLPISRRDNRTFKVILYLSGKRVNQELGKFPLFISKSFEKFSSAVNRAPRPIALRLVAGALIVREEGGLGSACGDTSDVPLIHGIEAETVLRSRQQGSSRHFHPLESAHQRKRPNCCSSGSIEKTSESFPS
jgi:hypothetical protein